MKGETKKIPVTCFTAVVGNRNPEYLQGMSVYSGRDSSPYRLPAAMCVGLQGRRQPPCLHFPAHSLDAVFLDPGPWCFGVWLSTVDLGPSALDDANYIFVLEESVGV